MAIDKSPPTAPEAPEPSAAERLDAWKEIAAYLKRDERTVRRWEKLEGLPVRRHVHEKRPTVYAYKVELDAWWNNRRPRLEAQEANETKQAEERRKKWLLAMAVAVLLGVTGAGLWLWRQRPSLAFQERDWVLIASFENRTREAVLDGTLEYALERELSNSRFVNVVPRERIEDTLRLMKKPADTRITPDVGKEVCLRDGGIRALLTGRVEKLGSTYVLSVRLVDPTTGRAVSDISEEANGQEAILPAVQRLSSKVRSTLGEELPHIQGSTANLAKVTTPSLRALQLYSQADAVIGSGRANNALAEQLLIEAIAEDPDFASAYIHLAWAMRNQGKPESEWRRFSERGVQLASTTPDRERYFIRGSYYQQTGQEEKALPQYEALLGLYPDHYWGAGNLAGAYEAVGQPEKGVPYRVRRAELRPNDFGANNTAARALLFYGNDLPRGKSYLLRAQQVGTHEEIESLNAEWIEGFSLFEAWLRGDVKTTLTELTRLAEAAKSRSKPERERIEGSLVFWYMTLGKLKAVEEKARADPDTWGRHFGLLRVAFLRNDRQAMREHLPHLQFTDPRWYHIYAIRAGSVAEAERALQSLEKTGLPESVQKVLRGELAAAQGHKTQAISLLREGLKSGGGGWPFMFASESLARLLEEQGDLKAAVEVLEKASQRKTAAVFLRNGAHWLRIQAQLAGLYHKVGREGEAQEIETELRQLLTYADPDHPILVELDRAKATAASAQPSPPHP